MSRVIRVTRDARTSRARPLIYRRNHSGSYLHSHRYKMFIRAVVSNCPLIITWMVRKTMEINAIAWSQVRVQFKRGFVPDLLAIAFNSWTTCNYLSRPCYTVHFFAQLVLQWWLSKHCNCKGGGVTLCNEKFASKCVFENKLAATIKQKLPT